MTAMPFSVEAIAEVTRADDSSKVVSALLLAGRSGTYIYTWDKEGNALYMLISAHMGGRKRPSFPFLVTFTQMLISVLLSRSGN